MKIFKKKMRPKSSFKSAASSSRRTTSSRDIPTNTLPSDFEFTRLSELELDQKLHPYLATLNLDQSKFNSMQRVAKEEILKQCMKRSESKSSLNSESKSGDVAQRFVRIATASVVDCPWILKELRDLRVFLTSEGLDWLRGFCEAGGASALINAVDRIGDLMDGNLSTVNETVDDKLMAGIIYEHIKCVRGFLNNVYGWRYCCKQNINICANLVNLLRVCNKTTHKDYDTVKEEILKLLLVISVLNAEVTGLQSGFQLLINGIDLVAKKHRQPRFQVVVNCLECEAIVLYALHLITMIFDTISEENWKLRILWGRDLWVAGFGTHLDRLLSSNPSGDVTESLNQITKQWKADAKKLDLSEKIDSKELHGVCQKSFEEADCGFVWNDILVRLLVLSTTSSDGFKDAICIRNFISEILFFGEDFNEDLQVQRKFSNDLASTSMHSDVVHLKSRLQKAVDEKQQIQSYQDSYFANVAKLQNENEKLRAHIQNPSVPIPEKSLINLVPPENFKPSTAPTPNVAPKAPGSIPLPPPPPSAASLKPNGGLPQPVGGPAKQGTGIPPAGLRPSGQGPPPIGPPPPLGAPFGSLKIAAPLPSYLQPKNETMIDVPSRKIVQWNESKIKPQTIRENSIWTNYQKAEQEFANDKLYTVLKDKFSRPDSNRPERVFKRKVREPVVMKNEKQLQMWDILSARTVSDVDAFKSAILQVDLKFLSEDTVSLVQGALLEPAVIKELRETPIEKFRNAPSGEKLIAALSRIKDLANRLRSIHLLITFQKTLDKVRSDASTFAEACDEIRKSAGLGTFAVLVLVCGNYMMRTKTNRQFCYGYLMSLLPKLVETKDVTNKRTLLDHLIFIFDSTTKREFAEFPARDFVQVERAKRLIFSDVIKSIDELNAEVKRVLAYHKTFIKQSEDDALGLILEKMLPKYQTEVEGLLCLKKSVESKAAEIERYFCFDANGESKTKYTLEDLIRDVFFFSTLYKNAYENSAKAVEKPKTTHVARKGKVREPIKQELLSTTPSGNENLLERLEKTLATNNYRMAKTPRRDETSRISGWKSNNERRAPDPPNSNKENANPRPPKPKPLASIDLDSLCLKVKEL